MDGSFRNRLQQLSDLDLAILVALTGGLHCIIWSDPVILHELRNELRLTCTETFGLHAAVVDCSSKTTVDDFSEAILVEKYDTYDDVLDRDDGFGPPSLDATSDRHLFNRAGSTLDERRIADIIIAVNLDLSPNNVQVQALELLRTKRIFSRTAMHSASNNLCFIAVASKPGARLGHHLNDLFGMSHDHPADAELPHIESTMDALLPTFTRAELQALRDRAEAVNLTGEVDAYLHNIVIFLRQSRYVKGGITATATRDLRAAARALAPLHGIDYVTPALVALAARKVYPHRLVLTTASNERTLLWGSDPKAIGELLQGVQVEDVIEEVIGDVEVPL